MGSGHFRRAAGIFSEIAADLNQEAEESDGLMSDDTPAPPKVEAPPPVHSMELCMKNVHQYGPVDERGWRQCVTCEYVNVAPPEVA
jgi:hypothetical protein